MNKTSEQYINQAPMRITGRASLIEVNEPDEEKDNGFADPAKTDVSITEAELSETELNFDEKLFILETAVTRHSLNREILYNILVCCKEESSLEDIEQMVSSCPEFKSATQSPYQSIKILVRAHGLDLIERDGYENIVLPEQKTGLTEDEIDDLVCSLSYITTDVGNFFVEQHQPKARLIELLNLVPERADTYIELLEYVKGTSKSYKDIEALLKDRPVLEIVIDGQRQTMQPSVLVDKLERAGALVWNDGWNLSLEGREFLEDLKNTR